MANEKLHQETDDPSANVQLFVGNAVKYLETLTLALEKSIEERFNLFQKLIDAEIKRINDLREGDVEAVSTANDRAIKQAEILATQMTTNAETLRASVVKTAETLASQLQQITDLLNTRITALEKNQYENKGVSAGSSMTIAQLRNNLAGFAVILGILAWIYQYVFKV